MFRIVFEYSSISLLVLFKVSLFLFLSLSPSVSMSVLNCLFLFSSSVCLWLSQSLCLSLSESICLSVSVSLSLSLFVGLCLSMFVSSVLTFSELSLPMFMFLCFYISHCVWFCQKLAVHHSPFVLHMSACVFSLSIFLSLMLFCVWL